MSPAPENWDYSRTWYHGSPLGDLTELYTDSAITQNKQVARAFSHKPSFFSGTGDQVQHNGEIAEGSLYHISEVLTAGDVYYADFPGNQEHFEWHINRSVKVELISTTQIVPEELIGEKEINELREMGRRLNEQAGGQSDANE